MSRSHSYLKGLALFLLIGSVLASLSTAASASCKKVKLNSTWLENPIKIDGSLMDWQEVPAFMCEDEEVVVLVANDANRLYLQFRTREEKWIRTIRMTGLTVYVNPKGKRKKDFELVYRKAPQPMNRMQMDSSRMQQFGDRPGGMGDGTGRGRGGFQADSTRVFTCAQEDVIVEKAIPTDGSQGPSVACDTSQGFYVYEFSIPLAQSEVMSYGVGTAPGAKIAVGLVWGSMPEGMGGGRPGGGGGGMRDGGGPPGGGMGGGPGGGGPPGGGMGGGPGGGKPGGGMGSRSDMPEEQEIWLISELATGQPEVKSEK